ncbi:MAG: hypothetical protein ABIN67_22375 [Ferruginibacter sp.]
MKKIEARELTAKHLLPLIKKYGYVEKKSRSSDFSFYRVTENGMDIISGGMVDYNPNQQIVYGVGKTNSKVVDILLKHQLNLEAAGISCNGMIKKDYSTFGPGKSFVPNGGFRNMLTEEDVKKCVNLMVFTLEEDAFPVLDEYEDLRKVDQVVNGNEPWADDISKPFSLGATFYLTRLITAKLCGNPNYDHLVDFTYKVFEKSIEKDSGIPYIHDRTDMTKSLPALVKILDGVQSIY